jgi:CTP-dependent riboflavin kinase
MQGWIKLHRQICDSAIWSGDEQEPFDRRSAWIDLLLIANHQDNQTVFDGKAVVVKRGQKITSVRKLAERWHWSVNRTSRYLKLLEDLEMITKESDSRRTLLTIVNYEVFQGCENSDEDSHGDSIEYSDRTLTNTVMEHSRIQSRITNKNVKNDKNEKKEKNEKNEKNIYGTFNNVKLTDDEYQKLKDKFPDYEQRIDNLSEYIASKGKRYSSHYATILNWSRKDTKPTTSAYMDSIKNRINIVDTWV